MSNRFYPEGTVLVAPDGTVFKAREPYEDLEGNVTQSLSTSLPGGYHGLAYSDELPEGCRIMWVPDEPLEGPGVTLVSMERFRHAELGYDERHDAGHAHQLVDAAVCYVRAGVTKPDTVPLGWPWSSKDWKPNEDPVRNLTKAGALIVAAIDSLVAGRELLAALQEQEGGDE